MKSFAALLEMRRRLVRFALMAAGVGALYGFIISGETLAGAVRGATTGLLIGVPILVFEISLGDECC